MGSTCSSSVMGDGMNNNHHCFLQQRKTLRTVYAGLFLVLVLEAD